jgi:hypothetical protein
MTLYVTSFIPLEDRGVGCTILLKCSLKERILENVGCSSDGLC